MSLSSVETGGLTHHDNLSRCCCRLGVIISLLVLQLLLLCRKIFRCLSETCFLASRYCLRNSTMKIASAIVALFLSTSAYGFAPQPLTRSSTTALASARQDEQHRQTVSSVLAAAFVAVNLATTAMPAMAAQQLDFGSAEILAARSGGRSGGRAASGGNSQSYRSSSRPTTTYKSYSSTTYVSPPSPTVIVSPSYSYGYSYNPLGGLATGYALGTLGNIGNAVQDARQEREIEQSRYQLEQARMKEAELEGRLRALEAQQRAPVAAATPALAPQ